MSELKAISGHEIREDIDYNTRGIDPEDKEWRNYGKELCDTLYYRKPEAGKVIAELKEERRWRKCSEELPQNGQDVWAYDSKSKSVLRLEYEKSDEGEGFIVFPYKHDFLQNITQWMPFEIPKAPED